MALNLNTIRNGSKGYDVSFDMTQDGCRISIRRAAKLNDGNKNAYW